MCWLHYEPGGAGLAHGIVVRVAQPGAPDLLARIVTIPLI